MTEANIKQRLHFSSFVRPFLPWLGIGAFLGIFFFIPMIRILGLGLNPAAIVKITPDSFRTVVESLLFTFLQATLSTLLTILLGIPTAFLFTRYTFRGKQFLRLLTSIPFMLPTVVVAAGFNALLGPRGWINLGLMTLLGIKNPPITFMGSLGMILLAHVFYNTTIIIRLVGNALSRMDPRLEQAARSLGASSLKVFTRVQVPLLFPSLLAAAMLVFIFDFTSFGVILLLGSPGLSTMEVEIYRQATIFFNLPLAGLLSLIQLFFTLVLAIIYTQIGRHRTMTSYPYPLRASPLAKTRMWQRLLAGGLILILVGLFLLPLISLPLRSVTQLEASLGERGAVHSGFTLAYYANLFMNPRNSIFYVQPVRAIGNSLGYALITVILSLVLGFPVANALVHPGRLVKFMDPLLLLPLGASAVTLGLGFIITFNKPPLEIVTSPVMVPIAHTLIALPFVIRTLQPALASIPERLRQAASSLGATPFRTWVVVDWPIVRRAVISASVFAFTISLGEFGASSLVVRPEYPTLPVAVARFLSQPGALNYGQAMAMATLLMLICGAGIYAIERMRSPASIDF